MQNYILTTFIIQPESFLH